MKAAKRFMRLRKALLILSIVGVVLVMLSAGYMQLRHSQSRMKTLDSIAELREQFNEDQGQPRLVLLLSPT